MDNPPEAHANEESSLDSLVDLEAQLEGKIEAARVRGHQHVKQARLDAEKKTAHERERVAKSCAASLAARKEELVQHLAEQSEASSREYDRVVAGLDELRDSLCETILNQVLRP